MGGGIVEADRLQSNRLRQKLSQWGIDTGYSRKMWAPLGDGNISYRLSEIAGNKCVLFLPFGNLSVLVDIIRILAYTLDIYINF